MSKWTIVAAALAVVVLGILGTLYYVAGTPQYTLYLVKKSIASGDREVFYRHFDVGRVVTSAVERAVGGVPAGPGVVSAKANEELIPASDKLIRERIEDRLDDPSAAPVMKMAIDSVRYQNNAAIVTLKDRSDGSTTSLTLERMPDRQWKIVDIDLAEANVQYSLNEARERAEELLPPDLPKVNKKIDPTLVPR